MLSEWLKDQAVLPILLAGAIVDIVQFLWLIKLTLQKARQVMEDRVRKRILEEMKHAAQVNHGSTPPSVPPPGFGMVFRNSETVDQ